MKVKRRKLVGMTLLTAGAGATLLSSCKVMTTGNLMAPPTHKVCLQSVEPPEAHVTVNEQALAPGQCVVTPQEATLKAQAPGYEDYELRSADKVMWHEIKLQRTTKEARTTQEN